MNPGEAQCNLTGLGVCVCVCELLNHSSHGTRVLVVHETGTQCQETELKEYSLYVLGTADEVMGTRTVSERCEVGDFWCKGFVPPRVSVQLAGLDLAIHRNEPKKVGEILILSKTLQLPLQF